ncbi:MAG: response regulator [Flavobacteriaceae bacterium]|nr:MAG: response regulator [Flavobacteriaceae bacterium]
MFQKVLIAEDMDYINSGIKSELKTLKIPQIDFVAYCDEALLKLKKAIIENNPFDLLISDLSFVEDAHDQQLKSGEALIFEAKKLFPDLKIIVFSVENKKYQIQTLFNNANINGYVLKGRDGLRELKKAIVEVETSDIKYISQEIQSALYKSEAIEITDYDLYVVECLSKGMSQPEISDYLKNKNLKPAGVSAIEKRLKLLKEHFNAKNPTHLVAITKDLGLI